MAKKMTGKDFVKIGVGIFVGAAGAEVTEHLVIPAVKKAKENKKAKQKQTVTTIDVNVENTPEKDEKEKNQKK